MSESDNFCSYLWDADQEEFFGSHFCDETPGHEGDHSCSCGAVKPDLGTTEPKAKD